MPLPPLDIPLDIPLPHQDLQIDTSSQLDVLPAELATVSANPTIHPRSTTQPNSFGLYRIYDERTLPISDPDDCSSEGHAVSKDQYAPYANESSFLLGEWYWNQGIQKSQRSFKNLLEIVSGPGFQPDDIKQTNWRAVDHKLGVLDASLIKSQEQHEWLADDAGWMHTAVTISVPFPRRSLNPGPKAYTACDFYHRSLTSIIRERVVHASNLKGFHFEPYELRWRRHEASDDVQVHGEMYTSKAFLKAHQDLQDSPPEPNCTLPRRVVALMFWSDATQLTSFGNTKLWPLYLYFGNESKYNRCQPSAKLCAHAAYFQTVGSIS